MMYIRSKNARTLPHTHLPPTHAVQASPLTLLPPKHTPLCALAPHRYPSPPYNTQCMQVLRSARCTTTYGTSSHPHPTLTNPNPN